MEATVHVKGTKNKTRSRQTTHCYSLIRLHHPQIYPHTDKQMGLPSSKQHSAADRRRSHRISYSKEEAYFERIFFAFMVQAGWAADLKRHSADHLNKRLGLQA